MRPYNLDNLPDDLRAWLSQRMLEPILFIEGGWEGWMQIDFPVWLDRLGYQFDIRREVPVQRRGDRGARLDWVVNSNSPGSEVWAFELKAQTHKFSTWNFAKAIDKDIDKLQQVQLPRDSRRSMLAAVIDNNAYDLLTQQYGFNLLTNWPAGNQGPTVVFLRRDL